MNTPGSSWILDSGIIWGCHKYADTLRSIDTSLHRLNLGYIDLLLIHEPTGDVHEIYRAMETAYRDGKLRAICVSNFMLGRYLDLIDHNKVVPAINQVETHVFRQQRELRRLGCQTGTKHEIWSPLVCGQNGIFKNPALSRIAENHGRSISQIAPRFLVQQGIIVIPKSTKREHMKENVSVLDFELEPNEMSALEALEIGRSLFGWR